MLEDETIFSYKCDHFYAPQAEAGVRWDDPQVNIVWPRLDVPFILSEKDWLLPLLNDAKLD